MLETTRQLCTSEDSSAEKWLSQIVQLWLVLKIRIREKYKSPLKLPGLSAQTAAVHFEPTWSNQRNAARGLVCVSSLHVQSHQLKPSHSSLQSAKSTAFKSHTGLTNTDLYALTSLALLETRIWDLENTSEKLTHDKNKCRSSWRVIAFSCIALWNIECPHNLFCKVCGNLWPWLLNLLKSFYQREMECFLCLTSHWTYTNSIGFYVIPCEHDLSPL